MGTIRDKYEQEYKQFIINGSQGMFIIDNAPHAACENYKKDNEIFNKLFEGWKKEIL